MHGSCGGARLQVRSGLRKGGFLRQVEAWWGPVVGQEPLPDNYDGPLRAIRLTFSDQKEAVVSLVDAAAAVVLPLAPYNLACMCKSHQPIAMIWRRPAVVYTCSLLLAQQVDIVAC